MTYVAFRGLLNRIPRLQRELAGVGQTDAERVQTLLQASKNQEADE